MATFKNSIYSNFYIGNCKAPTSDALIRFSLRARNDTLWTPVRKAIIWGILMSYVLAITTAFAISSTFLIIATTILIG
jgi:hypothetical protein